MDIDYQTRNVILVTGLSFSIFFLTYAQLYIFLGYTYEFYIPCLLSHTVFITLIILLLPKVEMIDQPILRKTIIPALMTYPLLFEEILLNSVYAEIALTTALIAMILFPLLGSITPEVKAYLEALGLVFASRIVLSPIPMSMLTLSAHLPINYTLILLACVLYTGYKKTPLREVGLTKGKASATLQLVLGIGIGVLIGIIEYLILKPMPISVEDPITTFIYLTIVMTVFVGLTEEVLFRGLLQKSLQHALPPWQAIGIVSLQFSLIHIGSMNPAEVFFAYIAGIVFGYSFYKTESLIIPVAAHAVGNIILYTLALA